MNKLITQFENEFYKMVEECSGCYAFVYEHYHIKYDTYGDDDSLCDKLKLPRGYFDDMKRKYKIL